MPLKKPSLKWSPNHINSLYRPVLVSFELLKWNHWGKICLIKIGYTKINQKENIKIFNFFIEWYFHFTRINNKHESATLIIYCSWFFVTNKFVAQFSICIFVIIFATHWEWQDIKLRQFLKWLGWQSSICVPEFQLVVKQSQPIVQHTKYTEGLVLDFF